MGDAVNTEEWRKSGVDPTQHLGLVRKIAKRYYATSPVEDSDQYSLGVLGLLRACEKFDESKGYKFSTYASYWIKRHILYHRVYSKASKQQRRESTYTDTNITINRTEDGEHVELAVGREPAAEDVAVEVERCERLWQALSVLSPRYIDILTDYYFDNDRTLTEVGKRHGITRERARQIVYKSLEKLRENPRAVRILRELEMV